MQKKTLKLPLSGVYWHIGLKVYYLIINENISLRFDFAALEPKYKIMSMSQEHSNICNWWMTDQAYKGVQYSYV